MLQKMRDNLKGTAAAIIIILLMVPFVIGGIDFLIPPSGAEREVAEVNGEAITEAELQGEIRRQRNQMRQQFGDSLPADFLSDENLRGPALQNLIQRELLRQVARAGGMTVPEEQIAQLVRNSPQFQENGRYSQDLYAQYLRINGISHAQFMADNIDNRVLGQLVNGLVASDFITDKKLARVTELSRQKRDFYFLTIPRATVAEDIEIADEAAREYYEANKDNFVNPEQVTIQYIELSMDAIAAGIEITEQELREEYQQEVAAFDASPERHAAHILVEAKDDGSEQQILEEIQTKLEAGEDFAALAEEYSEDLGSKNTGGDLGFTTGDTFPEAFETALAQLEVGEVSEPVQTESGYHIVKLLEVRGAEPPTFEEDRARIEQAIRRARANDIYVELSQDLEDLSYNATNLNDVGEQLDLAVGTAGPFSRSGGIGIAANPQVVEAAFSERVLAEGNTSDVLELGGDRQVVLRVTNHEESRTLTFDEVKTEVVAELTRRETERRLAELGAEIAAEVEAGQSVEEVAKAREFEWQVSLNTERTNAQVPREVLTYVFSLPKPEGDAPVVSGTNKNNGDYVVVSLTDVEAGSVEDLSPAEKSNLQQRLARMDGESAYAAFQAMLEARADIEREEAPVAP